MLACRGGHISSAQFLCSVPCDVNVKNQVSLECFFKSFFVLIIAICRKNGRRYTLLHLMAVLILLNISLVNVLLIMSTSRPS